MLKYCFAFDYINYAWYLSYQHVYLKSLEANNIPAISHLKGKGFGGSLSGQPFSVIHGDLVAEIFSGQTERRQSHIHQVLVLILTHSTYLRAD